MGMKRIARASGVFVCIFMLMLAMTVSAFAVSNEIDVSKVSSGVVTVNYNDGTNAKMKVAITINGKTTYQDYTQGTVSSYSLVEGNGEYTISLYSNIAGNSYKRVAKQVVNVVLNSEFAPYLASTTKVNFAAGDAVTAKAAELCAGKTSAAEKVVAIHNHIAANYTYDSDLAAQINSGAVTSYAPNANSVLNAKKGICYDLASLFAAMCRSQGVPCKLTNGYVGNVYHAWDQVYVNGAWQNIDPTYAVARVRNGAADFQGCISPRTLVAVASV